MGSIQQVIDGVLMEAQVDEVQLDNGAVVRAVFGVEDEGYYVKIVASSEQSPSVHQTVSESGISLGRFIKPIGLVYGASPKADFLESHSGKKVAMYRLTFSRS